MLKSLGKCPEGKPVSEISQLHCSQLVCKVLLNSLLSWAAPWPMLSFGKLGLALSWDQDPRGLLPIALAPVPEPEDISLSCLPCFPSLDSHGSSNQLSCAVALSSLSTPATLLQTLLADKHPPAVWCPKSSPGSCVVFTNQVRLVTFLDMVVWLVQTDICEFILAASCK